MTPVIVNKIGRWPQSEFVLLSVTWPMIFRVRLLSGWRPPLPLDGGIVGQGLFEAINQGLGLRFRQFGFRVQQQIVP